jgi:galactokinase
MNDIRDDTRDSFAALFGSAPSGLWSAPGALTLLGADGRAGTARDALSLSIAIGRRTVVGLALRDDSLARVASSWADELVEIDLARLTDASAADVVEILSGWAAYPLGIVWALGRRGADLAALPGFDLFIESDVPVEVGLGSSAALQTATALALDDVWRLNLDRSGGDRQALADVSLLAERALFDANAGIAPYFTTLVGERDSAVLIDPKLGSADLIPLGFEGEDLAILVLELGDGEAERFPLSSLPVSSLPASSPLVAFAENQRVLHAVEALASGGPRALGELLDASQIARSATVRAPRVELELAVETAQSAGAIGARMTGAGAGRSAIALVEVENLSRVQVAIDGAFSEHGYGPPDSFVVAAAHGASREP